IQGRRRVNAVDTDEMLCILECVAHLRPIRRSRSLDRLHEQHECVIGMPAKGRYILLVAIGVGLGVGETGGFLRIAVGELVSDEEGRRRQLHAIGALASTVDELFRGRAVIMIENGRDPELAEVLGNDHGRSAEAAEEYGFNPGGRFEFGELRGHVLVVLAVGLDTHHGNTKFIEKLGILGVREARLVEPAIPSDQADLAQAVFLHVRVNLFDCEAIGMRGLEHPLLHGIDDYGSATERDEGDLRALDEGYCSHGIARRAAADDEIDLVVLDKPARERRRLTCVPARVVSDELELAAEDTAACVDLLDVKLERLLLGIAQERGRTRHREKGTDLDRLIGSRYPRSKDRCRQGNAAEHIICPEDSYRHGRPHPAPNAEETSCRLMPSLTCKDTALEGLSLSLKRGQFRAVFWKPDPLRAAGRAALADRGRSRVE